ncbi:MAG TPA: formylglycine-generating enzyme family protein [Nitrosomonas sp.]|nr:formylglycine-generating enzyme family protein [Nitrosomonas sp.]HMW68111.1 formylglycine-generating enzyme family protein [Nitrosomonas sp.]HMY61536.1 formylglycine-generating enzyme family protein [Nitrosomonas sp.]HNA69784.1 formylglycine-generating enzyme family protein [Nitrosomonas sp.]HNG36997.1 formylglycine-generating enzyme family protein [Nitrosomonas sp.]
MAWGRLALIQAIGESEATLQKVAEALGFESKFARQPQMPEQAPITPDPGGDSAPTMLTTEALPTEKPHAFFLRVNRMETLSPHNVENRGYPYYLDDPALKLDATQPSQGTYRFAPPPPLLSMSRLAPLLHQGLGQIKTTSRIDFSRMVRHIAQGKFIRRLPRIKQQRWPQQLQIIVDPHVSLEPYWSDFAFIITALKKRLGTERVTALRFDEATLSESQMQATYWPTQPQDRWFVWQLSASDVPLLILSDLGMVTSDANVRYQWRQWITQLRSHAGPILTLSPALQSPQGRQLCALIKPHPLHDRVRLPRHPARKGFELAQPKAETLSNVLTWLSILPIIDTGLLRRLRTEMQWGGSELESLIWNHACFSQTSLGLRMPDSSEAQQYRAKYQQQFAQTPQAQRFWQIVHDHHAQGFEGLRQLERLSRSISEHEHDDAAHCYFQRVCATIRQTSPVSAHAQALQAQCRTVLLSLPDHLFLSDQQDVAYALYAMAYQQEIQAGQWPESLKPGFEPARLQWLIDQEQSQQRLQWWVLQTSAQGYFVCQPGSPETTSPQLPSAVLESLSAIPPTYQVLSGSTLSRRGIVRPAQVFSAADAPLVVETSMQRVELEAIQKPAWALRIKANRSGLAVDLPVWQGKSVTAPWQPGTGSSAGRWQLPVPFGLDEWGLYADLTVREVTQRFRWIVPGTFTMGSPENEAERREDETQHLVTLTQGFWLADSVCTQALWQAVMGGDNPAHFRDSPNHPVEQVSWNDVQQFIQTLNAQFPDIQARLPTEAEWEYACRAGTTTPFSFGGNITSEQVNYHGEYPYAGAEKGRYREKTVPVKSLPPNPWGLYEMHGNVLEWCGDWYGTYPAEAVVDPIGPVTGQGRVLRGGAWGGPDLRSSLFGFRLALGHKPASKAGKAGETGRQGTDREA